MYTGLGRVKTLAALVLGILLGSSAAQSSEFAILIEREQPQGKLVPGQISVNGKIIGGTLENVDKLILPSVYHGTLRYVSHHNFVQRPMGEFAQTGDFLLEVAGVSGRTDILLHGGNKPYQSTGCIMLGPVGLDPATLKFTVGPDHPLRKLRKLFYGSDNPTATPDKEIVITITVAKEAMARLPLQLLRTVAAVQTADDETKETTAMEVDQAKADSLEQAFVLARQNIAGGGLGGVSQRTIAALSDPSPIKQMSSMLATRLTDPTQKALASLATHILSEAAPHLLNNHIDAGGVEAFVNLPVPASLSSKEEALAYIDSSRNFFQSEVFSADAFRSLAPVEQAKILRMIQVRVKVLAESTDPKHVAQSLTEVSSEVTSLPLATSINYLNQLNTAIDQMADAKTSQISEFKDITTKLSSGITTLAQSAATASADIRAYSVPALPADIGNRVDELAGLVSKKSVASQAVALVANGSLPTQDLIKVLGDPMIAADKTLHDVNKALNAISDLQNVSATNVKDILTKNDKIVTDLATAVGVPPATVSAAKQIFQIGSAIAGGNYLAAAQAIPGVGSMLSGLGLGGGGGDDSAVLAQLALMDKKLDKLMAGQEEIKSQIKDLTARVDKLTDIVVRNHEEVMQQLTRIEQDVLINRAVEIEIFKQEYYSCYSVFDFQRPNALFQAGFSRRAGYDSKQQYFAAHEEDFERCQSALKSFLAPSNVSPIFTYRTNPADPGQSSSQMGIAQQEFLDNFVHPVFAYFGTLYAEPTRQALASKALLQLSRTTKDISDKYSAVQSAHRSETLSGEFIPSALTDYSLFINASALSEVADFTPTVLGLWSFVDFRTRLFLEREQLENVEGTFTENRLALVKELTEPSLKRLLQLLNTALAQQALLSGDLLLPDLARDVARKDKDRRPQVEAILKSNPLLRRNLTRFLIADHLRTSGTKPFAYSTFLQGKDVQPMQVMLSDPKKHLLALEFRHADMTNGAQLAQDGSSCGGKAVEQQDRWYIELTPTICEPLPSAEELDAKTLSYTLAYTSGWTDLYLRREHIIDALAAYDFSEKLTPDDLNSLWSLAANSGEVSER